MKYFPFDSNITGYDSDGYPIYDRPADSSLLRGVITQFVSTGIFPTTDCFKVEASEGMLVTVKPGSAVINGVTAMEETTRTLTVQSSDDTYDRIDTVVLRYNNDISVRSIDLYVLEGTPAATPTPPTLTRQTDYYELGLANLYIPVNSAVISDERITDTRTDEERCGYAKGLTQEFVEYVNERFTSVNESINKINTKFDSANLYTMIDTIGTGVHGFATYTCTATSTKTIEAQSTAYCTYKLSNNNTNVFPQYIEGDEKHPARSGLLFIPALNVFGSLTLFPINRIGFINNTPNHTIFKDGIPIHFYNASTKSQTLPSTISIAIIWVRDD